MLQIIPRYKIFPAKNVANGDGPKYFLQKMLQKFSILFEVQKKEGNLKQNSVMSSFDQP